MIVAARQSWTDVRDVMRARILDRTYNLGDRLPRDEDIARELGCTRTTVHRAMQDLASTGLIERRRKGGTHVTANPVGRATYGVAITRREVESSGRAYDYRLISRRAEVCPAPIAARLGLSLPREMLHIEALHLADNQPYVLEDRWVDLVSCPQILDVDLTRVSANEWLVRHKPYSRIAVRFYAAESASDAAKHMACRKGQALLVIERVTWGDSGPITYVKATTAPDYQVMASG